MKQSLLMHGWKRFASAGLSLAMAISLLPAMPVSAAADDAAASKEVGGGNSDAVPVIDKTPIPFKAGSISMDQLTDNTNENDPFPAGTAGSDIFRIPAMITMENGDLLAIADTRYRQITDGNGLDTIAAVSNDGGETWEYGFPFFFPDTYRDINYQSTSIIDPGLFQGPDGTVYIIADVYPSEYYLQVGTRKGTGYVEINGKEHLALTDDYANVTTAPIDEGDTKYLYYVGDFSDGYAPILNRDDHSATEYVVDEWYNLYSVDENGKYVADLTQNRLNNTDIVIPEENQKIQQNVYYKDSIFHVYKTGYLWMVSSKDYGRTWEHPKDIIATLREDDEDTLLVSPGRGLTTSDGTLVIGAYYHGKTNSSYSEQASLLYSLDNGETWNRTEDIGVYSSENDIVELEDGTLRMFHRHGGGNIHYVDFAKNETGGYDVGDTGSVPDTSIHNECNMGVISYSKKINGKQAVIASYPTNGRAHGKIFTLLVNEDNTMECIHTFDIPNTGSAYSYSSLTELEDGSIGLLWEAGDPRTTMWYDRFDIAELIPDDATLAGANGETMRAPSKITLEKGGYTTKSFDLADGETADSLISVPPNANVATAVSETKTASRTTAQAFAYAATENADISLSKAFGMDSASAQTESLSLSTVEFSFKKSGENWHVKHTESETWLAMTGGGDSFFSGEANDIIIQPQANGTVRMYGKYPSGSSTADGYAAFYIPWKRFNRVTSIQNNYIGDLTLWENDPACIDGPLPGYRKANITDAAQLAEEGKSYLITVLYEDAGRSFILLLNPKNGSANQTKLLVTDSVDSEPTEPGPVESAISAYAHVENEAVRPDVAFDTKTRDPEMLNVADMEFTFTKNTAESGDAAYTWSIYNAAKSTYMTIKGGNDYFDAGTKPVLIDFSEDGSVKLHENHDNQGRYAVLWKQWMDFNGTSNASGNNAFCNFTLWEKSDAAADSRIPGYQRLVATSESLSGKTCLISAEYNGEIFLLYPENGIHNKTKLYSPAGEDALPTYAYIPDSVPTSGTITLADAYKITDSTKPRLINPAAMEFTFTASGSNWKVQNKLSGEYLTIADGKNLFGTASADVTAVLDESAGTFELKVSNGRVGLHAPWLRFDRNPTGNTNVLWEKDTENSEEDASSDEPVIPGYHKVTEITDGGSYLIGSIYEGNIYLLYPSDGPDDVSNDVHYYHTKLLGTIPSTEEPAGSDPFEGIARPKQTQTSVTTVTITGVNEGSTAAVINGTAYKIYVTDRTEYKSKDEPIEISCSGGLDTGDLSTDVADVSLESNGSIVLYDRCTTTVAGSAASYENNPNADISIADAEFTFTNATGEGNEGKWFVKAGDKYLVHYERNGSKKLFDTVETAMTVEKTDGAATYKIRNEVGSSSNTNRYLIYSKDTMRFNAMSNISDNTNYNYEMTLWKKDETATDSLLPGYKRMGSSDTIEDNGVYLITSVLEENGSEYIILLWPKDTDNFEEPNKTSKLARKDSIVRITPKKAGSFSITIDGIEYLYQFIDPNCAHSGETVIRGLRDADCENGYTGDTVCSLCGAVITPGSAAGHDWDDPVVKQALTETTNGITVTTCKRDVMHQKITVTYASAYKRIKELFSAEPAEISDANKALYKTGDVEALKKVYDDNHSIVSTPAASQTNKGMYAAIGAFEIARKTLLDCREDLEREFSAIVSISKPLYDMGISTETDDGKAFAEAYEAAGISDAAVKTTAYTELLEIVTNLKAAYQGLNKHTATIHFNTGDNAIVTKTLPNGAVLTNEVLDIESHPYKGYVFAGWFTDAACQTAYDDSKPITRDLDLYAKWTEAKADVTIYSRKDFSIEAWTPTNSHENAKYLLLRRANKNFGNLGEDLLLGTESPNNKDFKMALLQFDLSEFQQATGKELDQVMLRLCFASLRNETQDDQMNVAVVPNESGIDLTNVPENGWTFNTFKEKVQSWTEANKVFLPAGSSQHYKLLTDITGPQIDKPNDSNANISGTAFYVDITEAVKSALAAGESRLILAVNESSDTEHYFISTKGAVGTGKYTKATEDMAPSLCFYYKRGTTPDPECSCEIESLSVSGGQILIGANAQSGTFKLSPSATIKTGCPIAGHPDNDSISYSYAVKAGTENNTAGASVDTNGLVTATKEGKAVITVTAVLGGKSKSEDAEIIVKKVQSGTYVVTFDANAGSDRVTGMPDPTTISEGQKLSKPSETPIRNGYTFQGWSRTTDGAVIADADWPLDIVKDETFYAVWEQNDPDSECSCEIEKLTVSGGQILIGANAQSGTFKLSPSATIKTGCPIAGHPDNDSISYNYAVKAGTENNTAGASVDTNGLVTATKEGKAVITVTAVIGGTDSEKSKSADAEIIVTKAKAGTYVITFDANSGSDSVTSMPDPKTVNQGEKLDKPSETPVRDGYTFQGWSRTTDGAVIADADWPLDITKDEMLYAVWEYNGGDEPVTKEEAEKAANEALLAADNLYVAGQGNYTKESWDMFKAAYQALKEAKENDGTEPADLKKLADDLDAARKALALDEQRIMNDASATVNANAKTIQGGNTIYTTATWNAYYKVYTALKNEAAEGGAADAAKLDTLKKAFDTAKRLLKVDTVWQGAKSALTKAISQAQAIYANGKGNAAKKYTDASWKAFASAYAAAYAKRNAIAGNSSAASLNTLSKALNDTRAKLKLASTLKKDDAVTQDGVTYVVLDPVGKTASAQGEVSKKKKKFKVTIKDTVVINNVTCTVTEVKAKGFAKFSKISQVTIGKNVTKIGKQAFKDCKAITKLTVNGDVKTFDTQCFNNCKKLKSITFKGTNVPTFKSKAFKGTATKMTVKLAKKMSKSNKKKMTSKLKSVGISKKAKIR